MFQPLKPVPLLFGFALSLVIASINSALASALYLLNVCYLAASWLCLLLYWCRPNLFGDRASLAMARYATEMEPSLLLGYGFGLAVRIFFVTADLEE